MLMILNYNYNHLLRVECALPKSQYNLKLLIAMAADIFIFPYFAMFYSRVFFYKPATTDNGPMAGCIKC